MAAIVETPSGGTTTGKPWVWIDDRRRRRRRHNHLLSLGHETVHYVSIPPASGSSPRATGWQLGSAGGRRHVCRRLYKAAGALGPGTRRARYWPKTCGLRRSCAATTSWHSGWRAPCSRLDDRCPASVSIVGFDDSPAGRVLQSGPHYCASGFRARLGRACFAKLLAILGRGTRARPDAQPESPADGPGKLRPTGTGRWRPREAALANGERYRPVVSPALAW